MVVKVDDIVMAHHGDMIYDAKVLKVDHGNGVVSDKLAAGASAVKGTSVSQYYVHYQGWHKKWDEWVAHDRVLEDTPANRLLQAKAKADAAANKKNKAAMAKKKKISASGFDPSAAKKSPFKKMRRHATNDTEEMPLDTDSHTSATNNSNSTNSKQIAIQMPFSLKKQLVEDWKHVTHEPHRLVPLPRTPTVHQIIQNYLAFKKTKLNEHDASDDKEYQNLEGIMEGIRSYFDRALGSILLYRMERKQFDDIRQAQPGALASDLYGAEHLIRLFVRLPVLLEGANLPAREILSIQSRLNDFLKFVQKHAATWFLTEYELASDKYVEQALRSKSSSA